MSTSPRTAVVIGGGITGLATAALLAREGLSVTVLEKQPETGGRAGSWETGGFRFDTGPSWYLMPEVFDHFFRMLGTSAAAQLDLVRLDPGYRVLFEDQPEPVDIAATREANIALFESLEPGAGPRLAEYLESAEEVYAMAKKRFLYSTFASFAPLLRADVLRRGPRLARLLLEPLSTFVAKRFTDPRIRQILGYPAVFLGSSPFTTPSMYHLMSRLDLADGVLYPMGGFARMVSVIGDLARAEGVRILTGAEVTGIRTTAAGRRKPRVAGVRYRDAGGAEVSLDADLVVSAADLHHTETALLPAELQTYPERYWQRRVPGPGGLLLHLGVQGKLPQLEHHTLLFTKDWEANFGKIFGKETSVPDPASLYVCRPSATDPDAAPDGHENLFVLVPVPSDPSLGAGGIDGAGDPRIEKMADAVIAQLSAWAGIPDLAERIIIRRTVGPQDFVTDLNSWRGTMLGPAHILKQSAFFRGTNASRKVDGLLYAGGSTLPGIGLPMCLISAELVLKRLRGETGTEALPEPAPWSAAAARCCGRCCRCCAGCGPRTCFPRTGFIWTGNIRTGSIWGGGRLMGVLYLLFLLLSLGCMALLDHRFRLFFFADARRAGIVLVIGVLFFTAWDLAGIGADIFYRGETPFMLGLTLAPHLPVEEIFFLAFLCYLTMVVFGLVRLAAGLAAERGANRAAARMQGRAPGQPEQPGHPGRSRRSGQPGQPGQPGRKPVRKPTERPQP